MSESVRERLEKAIASVTDKWDEPLDEVHDIPSIVSAILAAGFSRSPLPVEGEVEWQCVMPGLGWGPCGNPECHNPKRFRRAAGPWEVVAP